MILRGVIENTFGGALCMRGFARIGDLAKLSIANVTSYQRKLDNDRSAKILEFLKRGTYRFFPELIFGLQISDQDAIRNISSGKKVNFSNGIGFNFYSKDYKDYVTADKFNSPVLRRISLDFSNLTAPILSRIDGNHRLSAIDALNDNDSDEYLNYFVPFCIILQQKNEEANKHEHAYFHLINSNAKPLTSEENLKAILDASTFTDAEIVELLGEYGKDAKELYDRISKYQLQGINHILEKELRNFCLTLCKLLKWNNIKAEFNEMERAIHAVNCLYSDEKILCSNSNLNILLSLVFYKIKGKAQYAHFKDWIIKNQLFELHEVKARSIIEIFDGIHKKRTYKIFVAMPYWSHEQVNEYNTLFKEILKDAETKVKVDLELIPIMRFRGKSQRIDARLLESIEQCDIFIADITGSNQNVVFEIGFADGKNKPMILLKEGKDEASVPFDMDKLQWIPYNGDTYYNSIKRIVTGNLIEILKKEYNVES